MAEGGIGEPTCKPPTSKEELGGGVLGIIRQVSAKILPTNSTIAPTNVVPSVILEGEDYDQ